MYVTVKELNSGECPNTHISLYSIVSACTLAGVVMCIMGVARYATKDIVRRGEIALGSVCGGLAILVGVFIWGCIEASNWCVLNHLHRSYSFVCAVVSMALNLCVIVYLGVGLSIWGGALYTERDNDMHGVLDREAVGDGVANVLPPARSAHPAHVLVVEV